MNLKNGKKYYAGTGRMEKLKKDRMPLLLYDVRQVGKTYILREFGDRYFKNSIYVNFERMQAPEYFVCTWAKSSRKPDTGTL